MGSDDVKMTLNKGTVIHGCGVPATLCEDIEVMVDPLNVRALGLGCGARRDGEPVSIPESELDRKLQELHASERRQAETAQQLLQMQKKIETQLEQMNARMDAQAGTVPGPALAMSDGDREGEGDDGRKHPGQLAGDAAYELAIKDGKSKEEATKLAQDAAAAAGYGGTVRLPDPEPATSGGRRRR